MSSATLRLSRQTVRASWPAYLGAFVALASGVVLTATTVTLIGSVDATLATLGGGATQDQRSQLDDLTSMFGIMSAISLFMAIFVVGSTFGFVIATRRRELGLLRLIGATGRQVRRLVLGESIVVAVAAAVVGCLVATPLTGPVLALIRLIGLTDLHLVAPPAWPAWAIAAPTGIVVAMLGARRSARRAARISPSAALREATVERTRPSVAQLVVGILCLATVLTTIVLTQHAEPLFALVTSVLLPEVVVIAVMSFGTLIVPRLAALLALPFAGRDVTARLARDDLRAGVRTTTSVAAPVIAISAIAGSMLLALSFTADWTSAQDRAQLHAPLVVRPGAGHEIDAATKIAANPLVGTVDVRRQLTIPFEEDGQERLEVDAIDVATATIARGLHATKGDLARLRGPAVAVSETQVIDSGVGVGGRLTAWIDGRRTDLTVVAVVPAAPDLYSDILLPADLLDAAEPGGDLFVVPVPGAETQAAKALSRTLAGTGSRVLTAEEWIAEVTDQVRRSNNFGLTVLLGPAGFYAAIAVVNATLIGATGRRRQQRTLDLLGATRRQVRRSVLWQAVLVTGAGLVLGALTTALLGWHVRRTVTADLAGSGVDVPMTIPWLPLAAIVVACVGLALAAAAAGTADLRKRAAT
ncbi:MAG: FtsX-like permease family protein [Hamadaea sp.]|nr:FtsX-like permease family protein [Hamadaea sp.]